MLSLADQLAAHLEDSFVLQPTAGFTDLSWDHDLTVDEILAYEPGVIVEHQANIRRVILQRIRGELRYWLTTNRDWTKADTADMELGTVDSLATAAQLCREFLVDDIAVGSLASPRNVITARPNP